MPSGVWLYAYFALWALLVVETALLVAVIRQVGNLYTYWVKSDVETGLALGVVAPLLAGDEVFDRPVSLAVDCNRKTLIFFLSTECQSCHRVMHELQDLRKVAGADLVLVVRGNKLRTQLYLAQYHHMDAGSTDFLVLADNDSVLTDQYEVHMVPYAVVVDEDGRIGAKGNVVTRLEANVLVGRAETFRQQQLAQHAEAASQQVPSESASDPGIAAV